MNVPTEYPVQLLTSPWASRFYDLVHEATSELMIVSPFIGDQPLRKVVEILEERALLNSMRVRILTNLAVNSLLSGSLDAGSLLHVLQSVSDSEVTYLPSLHAKVYIADARLAIITSGNLTNSGLCNNREYGVWLQDTGLVQQIHVDLTKYAVLGNKVSADTLAALSKAAEQLKDTRKRAESTMHRKFQAILREHTEAATFELLKARAKSKTTHGIFCDTILYLLEQKGPMKTVDLHPLVQQIHPDLCDDSIDRVIDGVHFGKKWKHYVRNAQQALKRKGLIKYDGEHWLRT
jgi:hypothetical protein